MEFALPEKQRHTPSEDSESDLQVGTPERRPAKDNLTQTNSWGFSGEGYDASTQSLNYENQTTFQSTSPSISNNTPTNAFGHQTEIELGHSPSPTTRSVVSHHFDQRSPRVGAASSIYASPVSHTGRTPGSSNPCPWPIESEDEARLFLHFVSRLSGWVIITEAWSSTAD